MSNMDMFGPPWFGDDDDRATPGELILDDGSAVTLAVCGHWWPAPFVNLATMTPEQRDDMASGNWWAPIATCQPCIDRVELLLTLERIGSALRTMPMTQSAVDTVRDTITVWIDKAMNTMTRAGYPLREPADNGARAVTVLTSWDEGKTNPNTRDLAQCQRLKDCRYALGHPGGCQVPPTDARPATATLEPSPGGYLRSLELSDSNGGHQFFNMEKPADRKRYAEIIDQAEPIADAAGYLPCGCHGSWSEHTCDAPEPRPVEDSDDDDIHPHVD